MVLSEGYKDQEAVMARFQAFANAGDWGPIAREMLENGDLTEADLSTARGGIRLSSGRAKGEKKRLAAELQGSLALDFNADGSQRTRAHAPTARPRP